jgi:hypothetical protein
MKLVGVIALIYLFANMVSRPLSAGEIAFCIMLAVVDLILLTTDTERGGEP